MNTRMMFRDMPNGDKPILKRLAPRSFGCCLILCVYGALPQGTQAARPVVIDQPGYRLQLEPETGRYEIRDKATGVAWKSNPFQDRFGTAAALVDGKRQEITLKHCEARNEEGGLVLKFHPLPENPAVAVTVHIRPLKDGRTLEFAWEAAGPAQVERIRLLEEALWTGDSNRGYVVVPVREGLLIPADSGLNFSHRFDTYAYEGCHMQMLGVVRDGAAALLTWDDPYVEAEVRSILTNAAWSGGKQALSTSLSLRKTAKSFRIQFLGRGDYNAIAKAYLPIAKDKGYRVTWNQKLEGHPERAKYFGAINCKLWSMLTRRMNEDSSREESVRVNWTFDEAAQVAGHLKNDLRLDKVLFIMGGWIHRGYDNQHPDILAAAPECGGNDAFADCTRRIRQLGYVVSLHDNYQDIYLDAPSWDESFVNKNPDGSLTGGGKWAGGRAYITCAKKALELAQRPQNLPAVKKLTGVDSYFIDTTYAAGLYECFDPQHPMTRHDDLKWKQALSDYAREVFGSFGSECGREWAIPHADFFEGLTGVSGNHYHNQDLLTKLDATVVPLFELVYRDCIAMYGKYGYDVSGSAEYVLHHLAIGRPMHHHNVPAHLYWKTPSPEPTQPFRLRPAVAELKPSGPRRFAITYHWVVEAPVKGDWRVFVHFTDRQGTINFQNDHEPQPPTSQWKPGELKLGPFEVIVPAGLEGNFLVRIGLFQTVQGARAPLWFARDGDRSQVIGNLQVKGDQIAFEPAPEPARPKGDPALFTRGDNGWTEGRHIYDRFVKNTYELLSPLNEMTARLPMTRHEFLTADRKVQQSLFGEGKDAVRVTVNAGEQNFEVPSPAGRRVVLPPLGFLVESPTFIAFHAADWNGLPYDDPPLFTLRSLDGQPLERSGQVCIFHGFGNARIKVGDTVQTVEREAFVKAR